VTLLAALTPDGLEAVHGPYLYQVLGPALRPGDVVVPDNQTVHKVAGLCEIAAAQGLPDLPPCSPDFNPIELAFSKLKTWLRMAQARTYELLEQATCTAVKWISLTDTKNWSINCGHHVQPNLEAASTVTVTGFIL